MINRKIKFCLEIDPKIWKKFKLKCVQKEKKLGKKIEELIEEYIEK